MYTCTQSTSKDLSSSLCLFRVRTDFTKDYKELFPSNFLHILWLYGFDFPLRYQHPYDEVLKANATAFSEECDAAQLCLMTLALLVNWVPFFSVVLLGACHCLHLPRVGLALQAVLMHVN